MQWNQSFIVKDAINMLGKIRQGKSSYENSFQPEKLRQIVNVMLDCPERPKDFKFQVQAPYREYDNICLTSGGMDSTIAWYWANQPPGLYIDIGQSYATKEIKALAQLKIPYTYVDMRGTHIADVQWKHIIPGRNFLFLCVAAEMVKDNGGIWFSVVDGEGASSAKGDKSYLFIDLFEEWYFACTGRRVYSQTMTERTKAGWLKWFSQDHDVEVIRHNTVTCFNGEEGQCGSCQSCLRKYLAFLSIDIDISKDFHNHPIIGAKQYVDKYKVVLNEAIAKQDFKHYSKRRCNEDLEAIEKAEQ